MTLMDLVNRLTECHLPVKIEITVEQNPAFIVLVVTAGAAQSKRTILLSHLERQDNPGAWLDWLVAQITKEAVDNAVSAETAS